MGLKSGPKVFWHCALIQHRAHSKWKIITLGKYSYRSEWENSLGLALYEQFLAKYVVLVTHFRSHFFRKSRPYHVSKRIICGIFLFVVNHKFLPNEQAV